jgi:hypothetical protein
VMRTTDMSPVSMLRPRTSVASTAGRCSMWILRVRGSWIDTETRRQQAIHSLPVARDRSMVVTGATTMKGTLCRCARTAAWYVPI